MANIKEVREANRQYYDAINATPAADVRSAQSADAAAALAANEKAIEDLRYDRTADGRLDKAISDYLNSSGYRYDIAKDKSYQQFAQEHRQSALRGSQLAQETSNQLAGGYGNGQSAINAQEIYNDTAPNYADYSPYFRAAGEQEAAAAASQAGNAAAVYANIADTEYGRRKDTQGDIKNYINYLADKYSGERAADIQRAGNDSTVYSTRLSGALNNLNDTRKLDESRYEYNTLSADQAAKIQEDEYEASRKLEYTKAKDAYDSRVAAAAAAKKQTAANNKTDSKLKKDKENYRYAAWKMQDVAAGNSKFSDKERFQYDYNQDGQVDDKDLTIAKKAAETGKVVIPLEDSKIAQQVIYYIQKSTAGKKLSDKDVEDVVKEANLTPAESALVYKYFGF